MSKIDYHEIYRIKPQGNSLDSKFFIKENSSLDEVVERVLDRNIETDNYRIHKRNPYAPVRFSTDGFSDISENILILNTNRDCETSGNKTKPIVALRYESATKGYAWDIFPSWNEDHENFLGIRYVQTLAGINKNDYLSAAKTLGSRPHELLVANFLSQIAPIINLRPQTKVVLEPSSLTSKKTIRDRFFDKNWELNPNKERVRQLLGPDNAWLKPEAIESRYSHL